MTEPQTRIDGVRQQGCMVGEDMLVSVVAVDLMSAALWLVKRDGVARRIGKTAAGCPKIDSAWPAWFADGTARLNMAQADQGGGGASSHLVWLDFPDAVQPGAPATGGGSLVAPPAGELWAFAKAPWVGDVTVPLAAFIPPSSAALVRLVVTGAPGRMARLNNGALEGICQVAGVRSTIQGEIALDATQTLHLSVTQELAECHVQVVGWRPV